MDKKLKVLEEALLTAGELILRFDPNTVDTSVKSSEGDLVTEADLASERAIVRIIKSNYPEELIISEETVSGQELLTESKLSELFGWVIDPIDGTNNFKRCMSYSGISIGYIENGQIIAGGIYNPYRSELFIAEKGRGATCNGVPIHVSSKIEFDAGVRVCTSNSYEGGTQANLDRYAKLGHVWVDVLGSAVLIMTDVACGRLDLYHHNGLKPWDNAAAFLIAEEAGAKVVNLKGDPATWLSNEVVAGNPALVDRFIELTA